MIRLLLATTAAVLAVAVPAGHGTASTPDLVPETGWGAPAGHTVAPMDETGWGAPPAHQPRR
ncbi:hypothetical protein [Micromonospora haikouensis]|uniref:Uncharacterized protein n=1 Tax=Micromonospora haikouensis TaxID=686309 RepID=A0A0D0VX49_9ACTN|nr:hypothetical protein [Micromonospora haikouensis]KIR65313.1 hypothetical protein TK50_07615 [Micromonospora haikouensis]